MFGHHLPENAVGRTHGPLHLVVNHTFVEQFTVSIISFGEFQPMPLLGKVQFMEAGEKGRVQVNLQQVVKVFAVFAGERIRGPVAAGKCVHEGIQ